MSSTRDYYDVLGVPRDADEATIKKSFRRLARELHPDVNRHDPNAEEKFKEAAEAYEVLPDPERRGEVQGGGRGLRGPVRPRTPGHVRPLWARGSAQRRVRPQLRGLRLGG